MKKLTIVSEEFSRVMAAFINSEPGKHLQNYQAVVEHINGVLNANAAPMTSTAAWEHYCQVCQHERQMKATAHDMLKDLTTERRLGNAPVSRERRNNL